MKETKAYLQKVRLLESDVCTPSSISTVKEDAQFLKSFLEAPNDFELDEESDDVLDRLIEERLNSLGVSLVLKRLVVETWLKDGCFAFADYAVTSAICFGEVGKEDFASEVLRNFSVLELKELQFWLSESINSIQIEEAVDILLLKTKALLGVLRYFAGKLEME